MAITKTGNLINVTAFADAVSAKLTDGIKLLPLAYVQNFEGQPAGTISVPTYEYIGDAIDMVEGEALDPALLSQKAVDIKVKQAGKAVEITDKAIKSSYGDPLGEAETQVVQAIASKVEKDMFATFAGSTLNFTATAGLNATTYFGAMELFGEDQDEVHYVLANPNQTSAIKTDKNFVDGKLVDGEVIISNRVPVGEAYIVKPGAVGLYLAKDVEVEEDRDILVKSTVISSDEMFATHLRDASKVVKITFGE